MTDTLTNQIEPQQQQTKTQPDFYAIARNSRMLSQSRVFSSIDNANHFKDHLNKEWGCDDYSVIPLFTECQVKKLSDEEITNAVYGIHLEAYDSNDGLDCDIDSYDLAIARAVLKAAGHE